ncbi:MAG: divergent polysaccharide deacetylase family protein [Desulfocucumaceae bacterium]
MISNRVLIIILFTTLCVLFTPGIIRAEKTGAAYPLDGKTILLDPGHGGSDHGYCRKGSTCERDIVMEIAEKLADHLRKSGAKVIMTRERIYGWLHWPGTEWETSLDKRVLLTASKKADIFVSIHCNASPRAHRTGAVVFYQDNFADSRLLGDQIQRALVKIPENSKHTDKPGSYYLLNRLPVPAVVVETCYLTHRADKENIAGPEYQEKIAAAIQMGITGYFAKQGIAGGRSIASSTANNERNFELPLQAPTGQHRLTSGNSDTLAHLKTSIIPPELKIDSVQEQGGQLLVDIKSAGSRVSLGGEEEYRTVYTVVNNAFKTRRCESVRLTLNGKPAETLAGHIDISLPFKAGNIIRSRIPLGTREGKKVQVAIVIDDFGQYNTDGVKEILSLDIPVTCAVMPNLENTRCQAEEVARLGQEVIVHLPLEPLRGKKTWLGPGSITTDMSEEVIKYLVRNDFAAVPYAVGFNNHMGSAVTASDKTMKAILQVALEKEFFVLDSRTTEKTKIPALSDELGITCLNRNVFLDEEKNLDHVKKQLLKLSGEALIRGKAVGIGHVGQGGKITARALKEMIPQMEEMGIEFVYLSEMAY